MNAVRAVVRFFATLAEVFVSTPTEINARAKQYARGEGEPW